MLDANQSPSDCYTGKIIKPFSIEWLRIERGLDDPFLMLIGSLPNSTTTTPQRDIDYVLTHGIQAKSISTLQINNPAQSDHLGIVIDFDLETLFSSRFSTIQETVPRLLNAGNKSSVDAYIKYVCAQCADHKLLERATELQQLAV
jgi:hypothetical protein